MRIHWLLAALVSSAALEIVDHTARVHFLYWRYPWFDTLSHFLGGLTMGLIAVVIIGKRFRPFAYITFVFVTVVGWEIFEYKIGATNARYVVLDTKSDLLFDAIGGTVSYVLARFTLWRSV